MKVNRAVWVGLALLGLTGLAWGGNIVNTGDHYENLKNGQYTDASGNAKTTDASRDRDNWTIWTNAINDTITSGSGVNPAAGNNPSGAQFTAESTAVLSVAAYRRVALAIRVIPPGGDTTSIYRLAVQVRGHISGLADSSSTFPWYGWQTQAAVTAADSVGTNGYTLVTGGQLVAALPSEHIVSWSAKTLGRGFTAGNSFVWPDGIMLDLFDGRAQAFWFPYMSVRVRVLTGPTSAKPRVILHVVAGS